MTRMTTLRPILFALAFVSACAARGGDRDDAAKHEATGKDDGIDWCETFDLYGDQKCDRFCDHHDSDCALLGPDPVGQPTKFPFVIHHGFSGGHSGFLAFNGVADALIADGHFAIQTETPPFNSTEVRAEQLRAAVDAVLARTGAAKVNLIGHSMGGLDARYLVSTLGYGDRVASITTISTPHLGTLGADAALKATPGVVDPVVNALAVLLGLTISDAAENADVRAAFHDLSEAAAPAFNAANPDDPRVFYQSWAGVSSLLGRAEDRDSPEVAAACEGRLLIHPGTFDSMRILLAPIAPLVSRAFADPSDGLCTVKSARWGEFRGCIPADHSDEVGQIPAGAPDPRTSFDHIRFYRNLAFDLAARGF